ncbi:hypothetical protein IMG5_154750 [Ichthyophthirius multifiliis]|uniref:Arf-GAP domain-containing protein n=1 Tax=Ichthyophthirius multifiliis TaxID=5932 RepID=G0QZ69_ICHMU|nr:hypothetical protein IMG5_154750 [Ichthyophthirius multifiliis]EGR29492.1 hypothetical protein IMG5_154750 [Ichthyophthirius multifiliis]|eukprot:XP_004030728.1 hypothetical protein IMG5_154750 [Ichthyophthirius multifiliis]
MSMAGDLIDQQKQDKIFQRILKREGNQNCADCGVKSPNWVSLDFGVFVCMECSGKEKKKKEKTK